MKLRARLLFALALPLSPAIAAETHLDTSKAWFKPALVENRSSHCAAVLEAAKQLFYSPQPRLDAIPIAVAGMDPIDSPQEPGSVTTHGKKIYLWMRINPGCGSACETQQMYASGQPIQEPTNWDDLADLEPTPATPQLTLLKSPDDLYHVAVVVDGQLQLYTLTENAAWDNVCKVNLQPPDLYSQPERELQSTRQTIAGLQSTIAPLRQSAGQCGTLRAHDLGDAFMRDAFERTLYRPWTLAASNSRDTDALTEWSMLGLDEYAAMEKFRAQRSMTVERLTRFYELRFAWPHADAALAAENSVTGAIDRGFAFSSGPLFANESLPIRRAILENRTVAELETLHWQPKKAQWDSWLDMDSPLNVAVNHPAALRWLLSKQLDPNQGNAFGKTPLMYAAQHNALEAVRILLEHGANPNAATIFPEDTCTYTLTRANVTALHYAVRYGSVEIVQALVDAGALTSVKTTEGPERPGQTPREWLDLYASPNIVDADRPRLAQLLSLPDSKHLAEYSTQQTLQAEKHYAAGDLDAARRSLENALQTDRSNERALSDLSLVALRIQQYGESLEAATRLVAGSHDARMIANAWFNVGLACERSGRSYLSYNGETYCMSSGIFPFLQSWLAANSPARAEKLEQLFAAPGNQGCVVRQPDSTEHRYIFVRAADMDDNRYSQIQRIYVLHPAGSTVSATQIGWKVTPYVGTERVPRPVTPRLVASHRLGKSTLTVLESEDGVQPPVMIGAERCF